jgi:hypothetical protein
MFKDVCRGQYKVLHVQVKQMDLVPDAHFCVDTHQVYYQLYSLHC